MSISEVFNNFLTMATTPAKSTPVVIGLCGELMGGHTSKEGAYLNEDCCCVVQNVEEEKRILKMLQKHGGCDTALLRGHLFYDKDGKICIVAKED